MVYVCLCNSRSTLGERLATKMLHGILWVTLNQVQIQLEVRSTDPPYLEKPFPKLEDPTAYI